MCIAKHLLIALGPLWFGLTEIRHQPRPKLSAKEYAVADPQPLGEPGRIRVAKVFRAENQTDGKWHALNQCHNDQTTRSVLATDGSDVVQSSERNPVMNPQKENLKGLQCKQQDF